MRRLLYVAIALLAVGVIALVIARLREAAPGLAATVEPARSLPAPATGERDLPGFVGVIYPRQQVDVASSVEARVAEVRVRLGTRLARGEAIATLDSESLRREVEAATAQVRAAEAEARAARVGRAAAGERVKRLARYRDAVPGQERIDAANQVKLAASSVSAADARVAEQTARVEQLRVLLANAAVVAPFDGVVAARYVDPGALVGPGKPIVRLISADDLRVRFAVPEDQAATVQADHCVRVSLADLELEAAGVIETLAPQIDSDLRILFAEARLLVPTEARGTVRPGQQVHVVLTPCTTP